MWLASVFLSASLAKQVEGKSSVVERGRDGGELEAQDRNRRKCSLRKVEVRPLSFSIFQAWFP